MSDWWSKKLAGEKPTPARPSTPPVEVPIRFPQATTQAQQPMQPQAQQPQQEASSLSEYLRMGITKGGEAQRRDGNMTCPECGSSYVFSRAKGNTKNGASPAPRCYECGWNGVYSQADQSSWS